MLEYRQNVGRDTNMHFMIHQQCTPGHLHLHVTMPCAFRFMNVDVSDRQRPEILPMPQGFDENDWIRDFSAVVNSSWSRCMPIVGEDRSVSRRRRPRASATIVTVDFRIANAVSPNYSLPPGQNVNGVAVYQDSERPHRRLFRSFQHGVPLPILQPDGTLPSEEGARSILLHVDDIGSTGGLFGGIAQVVAVHEVGHAIGLDHSNQSHAACQARLASQPRICYGEPGSAEERSVMGAGMEIGPREYQPFVEMMEAVDPDKEWRADTGAVFPSNICRPSRGRERARVAH